VQDHPLRPEQNQHSPLLESFFPLSLHCGSLSFRLRSSGQRDITLVALDHLREEDTAPLLSPEEQLYLPRLRSPKRRQEWLGGRMAAKAALLRVPMPSQFQQLTLLPDEHGRPLASGPIADRRLSLSISHSGRYAAALAVPCCGCGIDLQEISDRISGLTHYFASAAELKLLEEAFDTETHPTRLTMLWAVKEAIKKSLLGDQPAIFSGIEVHEIRPAGAGAWQFACAVRSFGKQWAEVSLCAPYILAVTEAKS